jgi:hypothetical protein
MIAKNSEPDPEEFISDMELAAFDGEEAADHGEGFSSGSAGEPNDDTKSRAWQQGWADAQE